MLGFRDRCRVSNAFLFILHMHVCVCVCASQSKLLISKKTKRAIDQYKLGIHQCIMGALKMMVTVDFWLCST